MDADDTDHDDGTLSLVGEEVEDRSAANVRAWREYLPDECIKTMLSMGWDHST